MNDQQVKIVGIRSLSAVWLVPIVALVIALWLLFKTWQETGPTIEILFDNAAGIAVGKTSVRYRDVVIGEVTDIRLSDGYQRVKVYVQLDAHVRSLVSENSMFWVVAPRVSLSGVSGLNTLFSGVYIEIDPGKPGPFVDRFTALEEPPAVRTYEHGTQYLLEAQQLGSLNIGSPVYHRQVRVGEVTGFKLVPDKDAVQVRVFVRAPFDRLVHLSTHFWNVSGFGLQLNSAGISAELESLTSLLSGGVSFSTPSEASGQDMPAPEGSSFYLFENYKAVRDGAFAISYPYLLRFNNSVRGLKVGALVELYGIQIGEVTRIQVVDYLGEPQVLVYIALQPERLYPDTVPTNEELDYTLRSLIDKGLHAQLKISNLLTGSLFVDFVFDDRNKGEFIDHISHGEIPTLDTDYALITRQISELMEQVKKIPIKEIGASLQSSLTGIDRMVNDLNDREFGNKVGNTLENLDQASNNLERLLAQADTTLKSIDQSFAPDSELYHEVLDMAENISEAANALERLMNQLDRYPNALITGKDKDNER